jgi:hypothetical protein
MSVTNKYIIPACTHAHSHTYLCMNTRMCTHIHTEFKNRFPGTMYLLIYYEMYKINNEKRTHMYILTAM